MSAGSPHITHLARGGLFPFPSGPLFFLTRSCEWPESFHLIPPFHMKPPLLRFLLPIIESFFCSCSLCHTVEQISHGPLPPPYELPPCQFLVPKVLRPGPPLDSQYPYFSLPGTRLDIGSYHALWVFLGGGCGERLFPFCSVPPTSPLWPEAKKSAANHSRVQSFCSSPLGCVPSCSLEGQRSRINK